MYKRLKDSPEHVSIVVPPTAQNDVVITDIENEDVITQGLQVTTVFKQEADELPQVTTVFKQEAEELPQVTTVFKQKELPQFEVTT